MPLLSKLKEQVKLNMNEIETHDFRVNVIKIILKYILYFTLYFIFEENNCWTFSNRIFLSGL